MTPQDNSREEIARLAQRQDHLERQQRETSTKVDTLKWDVDSRLDSLRTDIDWKSRDGDRRVQSLERFRDFIEKLIMYAIAIGCGVAILISLIISIVDARDERREMEQLEERPLSSIKAPLGDQVQPRLIPVAHIPTAPVAQEDLAL